MIETPLHYLKLQLHAGDVLSRLHLRQLLHVGVETPGRHLCVPAGHGLQQRLMDEAVLVLRLHHVVPLRAHQCHVSVDVHRALVSNALQHGIDDNKTAGATDTGTEEEEEEICKTADNRLTGRMCWMFACVPAVSDDGPSVRRVAGFDPAEEVEERSRVLGNSVIRPGCELELTHLSPLTVATLRGETG